MCRYSDKLLRVGRVELVYTIVYLESGNFECWGIWCGMCLIIIHFSTNNCYQFINLGKACASCYDILVHEMSHFGPIRAIFPYGRFKVYIYIERERGERERGAKRDECMKLF